MARDRTGRRIFDEEVDEEQREEGSARESEDYIKKLNELLERVEPLVMSINSSYTQYAAGIETRPPLERLNQLEQIMNSLMMMPKPTPAYRFRYQHAQGVYTTYKTRWTKLVEDLESGKIKRFAGPKKFKAG